MHPPGRAQIRLQNAPSVKDTCSSGRDGLFSPLQIHTEASQAGAVILGLCLPEWGTVSDAAVEPPISSSTGVLHQVPGESSGSDSVSGEGHGQQGEKAAAGTSARLSCACQPGGCTGEAQMALSVSPGVPLCCGVPMVL